MSNENAAAPADLAAILSTMIEIMRGKKTKTEILKEQIEDVQSAIGAMPKVEDARKEMADDPHMFRFKLHVKGGHLEADIPADRAEELYGVMMDSLKAREAALKDDLLLAQLEEPSVPTTDTLQ